MVAFSVLYGAFTSKTWAGYFAVTWPVWSVSFSLMLSPWLFNPKSFEGLGVRTHFYEFLEWLDSEDGEAAEGEVPPWPAWHHAKLAGQAKLGFGSKLVRTLFGQVPKIALYCGALAALRVTSFNNGMLRVAPMALCSVIGLGMALAFYLLANRAFIVPLMGGNRWVHLLYRWALPRRGGDGVPRPVLAQRDARRGVVAARGRRLRQRALHQDDPRLHVRVDVDAPRRRPPRRRDGRLLRQLGGDARRRRGADRRLHPDPRDHAAAAAGAAGRRAVASFANLGTPSSTRRWGRRST